MRSGIHPLLHAIVLVAVWSAFASSLSAAAASSATAAAAAAGGGLPQETPPASDAVETQTVSLRVTATSTSRAVVIDRGESDGLAVGDTVSFYPRRGGVYTGSVIQIYERTAVVELHQRFRPEPGTRGDVEVPVSRFDPPEDDTDDDNEDAQQDTGKDTRQNTTADDAATVEQSGVNADTPPAGADGGDRPADPRESKVDGTKPRHPGWKRAADGWAADMPLLARVKPVRPAERNSRLSGRFYTSADVNRSTDGDRGDSILRGGTSLLYENPLGFGGAFQLDGELSYRSFDKVEGADDSDSILRLDRLSYAWGGTRFSPSRFEIGRFLQYGTPELGVVDGIEWTERSAGGSRYGASFGFMPEPDAEFKTGDDLQVAAYYYWVSDNREQITLGGAVQKTWHDGDSDRDLLLGKLRFVPMHGWDLNSTVWLDYYDSDDDIKDAGIEVTQAYISTRRRWDNGGIDINYRRLRFPELERDEFVRPIAEELADNRTDRLSIYGWKQLSDTRRLHAEGGVWDDEDDSGGDLELGLEFQDLLVDGSLSGVSAFGVSGDFESVLGSRFEYGRYLSAAGRWDLSYEIANHRRDGFSSDRDDILQHRLRASFDLNFWSGWLLSLYGQGTHWDSETYLSTGFYLQRTF